MYSPRILFVTSEESNLILVSSNDLANQLVKTFTDSSALRTIPSYPSLTTMIAVCKGIIIIPVRDSPY